MAKIDNLSDDLLQRIQKDNSTGAYPKIGFDHSDVTRRFPEPEDKTSVWRPPFAHDTDTIVHCPYYNRYNDKTQVFSLTRNDDITRRSLHVQLVSRIARTIGKALHLNLDLIEAIALGHDLGHPPFAHTGETYLDQLSAQYTGRHFSHNIQSIRVLDRIFPYNLSLQTLSGIAGHNGEIELEEYHPVPLSGFEEFDALIEKSYEGRVYANRIQPSTLEGAVVRISDIIAYLGRDRQDAVRMKIVAENDFFNQTIGTNNSEVINNLVVNIVENSYGKPYIKMDKEHFEALKLSKRDNYSLIYENAAAKRKLELSIKPMMAEIYGQLLEDLQEDNRRSPIFTHHIDYVNRMYKKRQVPYGTEDPNQIVVDYIASMTDDYFVDIHHFLFPDSQYRVEYKGYFD